MLQGLALGFAIAAPVGPVGLLCIRRTMERGIKSGVSSGLGAASADAIYGSIAAAGLTLIADFLTDQKFWLGLGGGLFLLYLGIQSLVSKPPQKENQANEIPQTTLAKDFFSTLVLTLSNPMTIFSFIAIFSGFNAASDTIFYSSAFILVLGVFCGSAFWWLTLSIAVNFLRQRITDQVIFYINKAAGLAIIGFAIYLILQTVI
jgi:threonine/homoserine/homoserine lactone efflux protein